MHFCCIDFTTLMLLEYGHILVAAVLLKNGANVNAKGNDGDTPLSFAKERGRARLVEWLKAGSWRGTMVLMFQKEVALRICGAPDDDHYGRLAVLCQAVTRPRLAITLPPGAFRPPPKIDSAVVVLEPLPEAERFDDLTSLEKITASAFGQRRKMLRAALKSLPGAVEALQASGIDPTRRAETLTQAEFRVLTKAWRGG